MYYNLVFGDIGSLTVGGETRQDSGEAQQYNTVNRQRTTTTYDYGMRLSNWAMFLQGQIKPAGVPEDRRRREMGLLHTAIR